MLEVCDRPPLTPDLSEKTVMAKSTKKPRKPLTMTKGRIRVVRTVEEFKDHTLMVNMFPDKANADIGVLVMRGIIVVHQASGVVMTGEHFPKVLPPQAPGTGSYLLNPDNQALADERREKILAAEASRATILDVTTGQPIRVKVEGKSKTAKRARGQRKKFDRKVAKQRATEKIAREKALEAELAALPKKVYFKLKMDMMELYPQMTDTLCKRLRDGEKMFIPGYPMSDNAPLLGAEKTGNSWKYYRLDYPEHVIGK